MDFLIPDIILAIILIVYFIYLIRNRPTEDKLFEKRVLSFYSIITYVIITLIALIILIYSNKIKVHLVAYYCLFPFLFLIREPKKISIHRNGFYINTIFGGFIHIGDFTELLDYRVTKKGHLKLKFEEPDGYYRRVTLPSKFKEDELEIIISILLGKSKISSQSSDSTN